MLQRSGEALYSSCAGDSPRTCSANICPVISKCTSRCSRSSLEFGMRVLSCDAIPVVPESENVAREVSPRVAIVLLLGSLKQHHNFLRQFFYAIYHVGQ